MLRKTQSDEKVVDVSPIRLSADESRLIFRATQADGKPINGHYSCHALEELGILKAVPIPSRKKDTEAAGWLKLVKAVSHKDVGACGRALETIRTARRSTEGKGYVLTDLGKQIARGLSVRLSSQFRQGR